MAGNQRQFSPNKRILILVGILIPICAAGLIVVYNRFPSGLTWLIRATPTPLVVTSSPLASGETGAQGENFSMDIQLSEGQAQPQPVRPLPLATGEPLTPDQVAQLLSRLPDLPVDSSGQVEFNRPAESLPPPRPGVTVKDSFPPAQVSPTPAVSADGPLEVLRFAPQGEIPIAPFVSLTFNQPMVPLGTLSDLAATDVPARIEPDLKGTWRWLGAKTLTFQYDSNLIDRLPKATEYLVTVPAGTRSLTGAELAGAVTWTFTTPPPKITASYPPDTPQGLTPLFFIAFDQRIDPSAVMGTVNVTAGGAPVSLVLATADEVKSDEHVSQLVKNASDGRWLAFRAQAPLPAGSAIAVTVGPGTPSAEGPLVTTQAQHFGFSTYSPLRIEQYLCGWSSDQCPPLAPFIIRFNNPLDLASFNESMLHIEPATNGLSANVFGNTLQIDGQTKGRTTYTVTISGEIKDAFGQKLGADARLTFKVGSADKLLAGPNQNFVTLDPTSSKPVLSVFAINYQRLNLKIFAVQPADWPAFKQSVRDWHQAENRFNLPGKLLSDRVLNLSLPPDELSQVDVDLSGFTQNGFGQFVVMLEPPKALIESDNDRWTRINQTVLAWVQVTQIGLDAFSDNDGMLAWATDLKNGAPLAGVTIQPAQSTSNLQTGADGTARFPLPSGATYLVARLGADLALLPRSMAVWDDSTWDAQPQSDLLRFYVFDDRKMYKPGEQAHLKGWLRRIGAGTHGDVELVGSQINSVSYRLSDPQGNSLAEGRADVSALGGFDFVLDIPSNANLGTAQLSLSAEGALSSLPGAQDYHLIEIQEFRRPEFEVNARTETGGPYFAGDQAVVAVKASYYSGGPLPNAGVTWQVTTSPTNYSPPNWPDFTFGVWQPWWDFVSDIRPYPPQPGTNETFSGVTDANGEHFLRLNFSPKGDPRLGPRPQSVSAESTVMDVNRQAWTSSVNLLVHPANVYIGIRSERTFVELNAPLKVEFIVTDLNGVAVGGRDVNITASRLEWKYRAGEWVEEPADTQTCDKTSGTTADACIFQTPVGGTYRVTATVTDELGRANQSRFTRWVSGGKLPPSRTVEQEKVTIIPDKQTYQPGETAHLLVQAPFSPAEGLLTVSHGGLLSTRRFRVDASSATLDIPIQSEHIPNLQVQVDLAGSTVRVADDGVTPLPNLPPRPAYASGQINLSIPPLERSLAVQVTPDEVKLSPGAQSALSVSIKDSSGLPVPDAELAVVVVDEAILALTDYHLDDPLGVFYFDRFANFSSVYTRASLVLADPQALAHQTANDGLLRGAVAASAPGAPAATQSPAAMEAPRAAGKAAAPGANPFTVRSDFNPLAAFYPAVRTGPDGMARVPFTLPDNLTRYRVMVVAVDSSGRKFGSGESAITARLPLMVRPSAPRFLNFGDKIELPVVLQNQTDSPLTVDVAARASNLELASAGLRVSVPANDRLEVRFPASTVKAGTAHVQVAAVSGSYADAASFELPVYTPSTSEAFATYGVLDAGALAQPVTYPHGVFPQYGGLEITTSSTALQALTDAVLYLVSYPYDCSEQIASRILAISSLRDVLSAFKADGLPSPAELEQSVDRDLQRLAALQNDDGGFPTWRRGFSSDPFNSVHVAHALQRAAQKGFSVPPAMQQSALAYLRNIENYYPAWYGQSTRRTLSAYALYVRNLMNDRDSRKALALLNEAGLDNLSLEAIGWLWPVIDDPNRLQAIRQFVTNRVVETAGAANFTTAYDDQSYLLLSSDRRTDAILLDALMSDSPKSDLIPKLVNGLLAHRSRGRWNNTQENVFVLLALDKYFTTYEAQTPDFVARFWLGNTYAGSSEFHGRTTDLHETLVPMTYVLSETSAGSQAVILSKDGPGRLYYRLGLRYAPQSLQLDPLDMGFVVRRTYEALDDPKDVTRDSDGAWHIKAGARVRVHISMLADNRRYHVALVDPLPAGLEIVNPALAVSGSIPQDPGSPLFGKGWWWWGTWYEHQNLRDDRAEAFASLLWEGVYDYTYIARATTPGSFIVPPSKAEEMYSPETFGRSASDTVIIN